MDVCDWLVAVVLVVLFLLLLVNLADDQFRPPVVVVDRVLHHQPVPLLLLLDRQLESATRDDSVDLAVAPAVPDLLLHFFQLAHEQRLD